MVNINYKISDELHRQLKIRAATTGETLKALVERYLAEGIEREAK